MILDVYKHFFHSTVCVVYYVRKPLMSPSAISPIVHYCTPLIMWAYVNKKFCLFLTEISRRHIGEQYRTQF